MRPPGRRDRIGMKAIVPARPPRRSQSRGSTRRRLTRGGRELGRARRSCSPRKQASGLGRPSLFARSCLRPQASAWQRAAALLVVHQSSGGAGVTVAGVEQQHDQWALRPTAPATVTGRAFGAGAASLETRGKENRRGASTARRSHPRAEPPVRRRRQDTCRASPSESFDRDDQALPWPLHLPAERPSRSNRPRCGTRPPRRRVVVRMDHEGRTLARPAH